MFSKLPIEIFLFIRSYLVVFDVAEDVDEIQKWIRQDAERSWRTFLAASRDPSSVRKEAMIWVLNKMSVKRYMENEQFRLYLDEKMSNPTQQLQLNFTASLSARDADFMLEILRTSNVGYIKIRSNAHITELPSSSRLQVLSLCYSESLTQLGDYPNLQSLQLLSCPALKTIDRLDRLHAGWIEVTGFDYVLSMEQLLMQFPLEQIQKLILCYIDDGYFQIPDRLTGLKYLQVSVISVPWVAGANFYGELFPLLIELHTDGFDDIYLAGMTRLRHLKIKNTLSSRIFEAEEIFPQLESFYVEDLEVTKDSFDLSLLINVTRLSLHDAQPSI
jgi:hypothetical protein